MESVIYARSIEKPAFYTSFVGRRSLLAEVRERLASSRVVTLVGPGGVGKTRVAVRIADEAGRSFRDGCWVVPLGDLAKPELLGVTVAVALGLQVPDRPWRVATLADHLADRTALLVLDNCEHLLAAVGDLVEELRASCPNLRFLLTSRRPLRLGGEDVIMVPPLSLPDPGATAGPEGITHYEAVNLFVDRATSARSGFELTQDNAPAVVTLCRSLEGIPLGIELAAARIRVLSPEEICDSLSERLQVLSTGYRDAADRHQSLRASVEWSYRLCTDLEQRFWTRSSVFAGGFDLESAAVVCGADDLPTNQILDLVSALVDQSVLVTEAAAPGQTRYRMLTEIRQFGLEQAEAEGELRGMQERHASRCAQLVSEFDAEAAGARQPLWLRRLRQEHANLRSALEHLSDAPGGAGSGLVMARQLDLYWSASGLLDEARHWLELGLTADAGPEEERVLAIAVAARFAVLQNDRIRARELLAQGYEVATPGGSGRALGLLLVPDAMLTAWEGDPNSASERADRAAAMLQTAADPVGELLAIFVAGLCHGLAADGPGASLRLKRCILRADEFGERRMKSLAVDGLGEQELAAGNLEEAAALFRSAIGIKRDLGDRLGIAVGLDSLGRVATAQQQGERGAMLLGAAEGIWDEVGMSETGNPFAYAPSRSDGLQRARTLLGSQRFRELFRRGSQLGLDGGVRFALEEDVVADAPNRHVEPSPLTRRELEVADLVADGLSNPEIAARLFISVRTAQGHVENILRKLGFNSRSLIAAWVTERRLADAAVAAAEPGPVS